MTNELPESKSDEISPAQSTVIYSSRPITTAIVLDSSLTGTLVTFQVTSATTTTEIFRLTPKSGPLSLDPFA
jgi:hypothetical protein